MTTLSERIRKRRVFLGHSVRAAAKLCEVTTSSFHRMETGRGGKTSFETACRILIGLGFRYREIYVIMFDLRHASD